MEVNGLAITVATYAPLDGDILGSRSKWGEAWWTSRDVCLMNQPELPDPLRGRIESAFINGV